MISTSSEFIQNLKPGREKRGACWPLQIEEILLVLEVLGGEKRGGTFLGSPLYTPRRHHVVAAHPWWRPVQRSPAFVKSRMGQCPR